MDDSMGSRTIRTDGRGSARSATGAPDASRRVARRAARSLLVVTASVVTAVILIGSPLRLFALVGDVGASGRPTMPSSDGPTRGTTASVPAVVTETALDGPDARSAAAVPSGDVTAGRWGNAPDRPGGIGLLLEEFRGGWRVEGGNEEAAALAVIAAHAWADVHRRPSVTAPGSADVKATGTIVAVEAVERPGAHHAVVTVLVAPDGAAGALHRIAIPLEMGRAGPSLAGAPWHLPAPAIGSTPLVGTPIADPELITSARRALDTAGLPGDRLVTLEATEGWPFIARLDDEDAAHPWLRWHLDRFVVAGLPLARTEGTRP
jgi:hypothetical protein